MSQTLPGEYVGEYEDRIFTETPFIETRGQYQSYAEPRYESAPAGDATPTAWRFETPFELGESLQFGDGRSMGLEVATLTELTAELKDHLFRESLEALATEAVEAHAEQLAGEYGDREQRDVVAERLLEDHFAPLAAQLDSSLEQLFERLEAYEAGTLTESEIDRVIGEIAPAAPMFAPASDQFLTSFLRKAGKLAMGGLRRITQGAVDLAGKGLAAVGKLALGPLMGPLKRLGHYLLKHITKFALDHLPAPLRPMARQLSDRLFRAVGETHEHELADHEQTAFEVVTAGTDVARLEAEFDVAAAQLLLTPEEAESEYVAESYGEADARGGSLSELDDARARLIGELQRLGNGESPQPVMEQFLPAMLWPIAKTAASIIGQGRLKKVITGVISSLIRPIAGDQATGLLAPAIANAGMNLMGIGGEVGQTDPRALAAEALAATVEETINRLAEYPASTFEDETLVESAVREAFEDAAATYVPNAYIKPALRETHDQRGVWMRMPHGTHRKRYAKYSDSLPVTITPRVAEGVQTFGHATLRDHLRDRMDLPPGQPLQTRARVYQVLPGSTTSSIARAEGIHPRDLHPLTAQAAGALFGPDAAGLAPRGHLSGAQISSPHRLHLRQRLYYIEPPNGRSHQTRPHARLARSEVAINLAKGEIRLWLYLSEPLTQQLAAELAKSGSAANAHRLVQPLIDRVAELIRSALHVRKLPPALRIIGESPNLEQATPSWLVMAGGQLASKIAEWTALQVAQYLRNNAEQFRKLSAAEQDGVTLRITMTRVPGFDVLRQAARGQVPAGVQGTAWLRGEPAFEVVAAAGYAIR